MKLQAVKISSLHLVPACFLLAALLSAPLAAGDSEANKAYLDARAAEKAEDYSKAAKEYSAAQIYADDPVIKANALHGAARAYRKQELYGKEFDSMQQLVKEHLNRINYAKIIDREYEIADAYFAGHRDTAVSWLPFIKKEDRTIELYETALKNAPCSERAPQARLRLGRLYLNNQKGTEAIHHFKETIKLYPGTDAARYASLELSNTYLQLSRRGDGDGAYARQALESLDQFLAKYPNDPECGWARRAREEVNSTIAKRLHGLGVYYHRMGRNDVAEQYLSKVVRDYSNSVDSESSEKLLAKIDKTYTPPAGDVPRKTHEVPQFKRSAIPQEAAPIMVVPENSDGKWLFPVRDLKRGVLKDSRDPAAPERKIDDDAI